MQCKALEQDQIRSVYRLSVSIRVKINRRFVYVSIAIESFAEINNI